MLESPTTSNLEDLSEAKSQHSIYEEDEPRRPVCAKRPLININSNDFRVDIPEFEAQLDPKQFLGWLSTIKRVFEHEDVPEDKKVKLVALKLRKYASLRWINLCAKKNKKLKREDPNVGEDEN